MDPLVVFLLIIILITVLSAKFHVPPFLTLTGTALLFGLLTGMGNTTVPVITEGMGKIFALLGIPIFSGAVIAMVLSIGNWRLPLISAINVLPHFIYRNIPCY